MSKQNITFAASLIVLILYAVGIKMLPVGDDFTEPFLAAIWVAVVLKD